MNSYVFLDYFFLVFHSLLIILNVFGWIPRKTRKLHWIALGLTLFSWLIMGFFYGWGYCILTDWHWDVLAELGERPTQNVYLQYLFERLLNWEISRKTSDILTVSGLLFGISGAILAFFLGRKSR